MLNNDSLQEVCFDILKDTRKLGSKSPSVPIELNHKLDKGESSSGLVKGATEGLLESLFDTQCQIQPTLLV